MRVRICHAYFQYPNLRNVFGEWFHYRTKRKLAKKYKRLLPHICEILNIPINTKCDIWIRKNFDHNPLFYIWEGAYYNPTDNYIQISMDEPSTGSYWTETVAPLLPPNFDWHVYTLAHEMAHLKQYLEGRLIDRVYASGMLAQFKMVEAHVFEGKEYSRYHPWGSHYEKPWEIDANSEAIKVISGLHIRGLQ
jgi:hypothetical protein